MVRIFLNGFLEYNASILIFSLTNKFYTMIEKKLSLREKLTLNRVILSTNESRKLRGGDDPLADGKATTACGPGTSSSGPSCISTTCTSRPACSDQA